MVVIEIHVIRNSLVLQHFCQVNPSDQTSALPPTRSVDHTCLAKRYFVCFQTCLLPEFFFFLSWQPSTVVLDRHLLAKDIVYVFFCCYCGFGNILAYWSNCMYLT
ncbi:hypothetical protein Lser_V15G26048 [Lactuca serriola]